MNDEFISRQQVKFLPERIRKACETTASKDLTSHMWILYQKNNFKPMNILVVGAGGSFPAAVFIKHSLHEKMNTPNVEAATPQTAIRIITQFDYASNSNWQPKYDVVIGISYSGKTPDIKAVHKLCMEKDYPFVLLTGAEKSTLDGIYNEDNQLKIISYFNEDDNTGTEKGLISMASTLAPIVVFNSNGVGNSGSLIEKDLSDSEKFVAELNVREIAASLKVHPTIHVFYEWDTLPAAYYIESKFIESGVATVVLHEKKNFSHGRTTLLYTQDFALVINLTKYRRNIGENGYRSLYRYEYEDNLAVFLNKICKDKSAHYLELGTAAKKSTQWNIEAMTKIPYFITAIGEELGIDISKPLNPYPKEVLPLYDYRGKL